MKQSTIEFLIKQQKDNPTQLIKMLYSEGLIPNLNKTWERIAKCDDTGIECISYILSLGLLKKSTSSILPSIFDDSKLKEVLAMPIESRLKLTISDLDDKGFFPSISGGLPSKAKDAFNHALDKRDISEDEKSLNELRKLRDDEILQLGFKEKGLDYYNYLLKTLEIERTSD